MARSLALHNEILYAAFEHNGGVVYSTMGDGMAVAVPVRGRGNEGGRWRRSGPSWRRPGRPRQGC